MATYTIVSSSKIPLDPGEINAGGTITVAEGDVFIIDEGADINTTFDDGGAGPFSFEVQFNASNSNSFDMTFNSGVDPTVTIADNVDLSSIKFNAQSADSFTLTAGDGVTTGGLDGSQYADTITLGDNFTANANWNLLGGNDVLTTGINADFGSYNIQAGTGDDNLSFGDGAVFNDVQGEHGNDTLSFGDNIIGTKITGGDGDDLIVIGSNATISNAVDGSAGNDTLNTQTTGLTENSLETTNVVCFALSTLICTPSGQRAVETLKPGDLVMTLDHGPQAILWTRSCDHDLDQLDDDAKPILIRSGAFAPGRPSQDLIVSPQHRVLVGGHAQIEAAFHSESFAPAKSLTSLRGIRRMRGKEHITWVHFACERHEVVTANGCLSESLLLGPMAVNALTAPERQSLTDIFGLAPTPDAALNGPPARECLKVGAVRRQLAKSSDAQEKRVSKEIRKWDVDLAKEQHEAEVMRKAKVINSARRKNVT